MKKNLSKTTRPSMWFSLLFRFVDNLPVIFCLNVNKIKIESMLLNHITQTNNTAITLLKYKNCEIQKIMLSYEIYSPIHWIWCLEWNNSLFGSVYLDGSAFGSLKAIWQDSIGHLALTLTWPSPACLNLGPSPRTPNPN